MGEANRRKELGLLPRNKKYLKNKTDTLFSWLTISKKQISKYPYVAPITMAIGLVLLLIDWDSLNVGSG
tara:strand:+ start:452 stop:658 length:207 start_codon:yes stop_codon:yes gene_type:complete